MTSVDEALIQLLRAEVESSRAEADSVRSSIRYRLGDVLLQALPLSFRSVRVVPKLMALLLTYRRNVRRGRQGAAGLSKVATVPADALSCQHVVFNPALSFSRVVDGVWQTNDKVSLVARLEAAPLARLELHAVTEPIARRLARLQWQGTHVDCHDTADDPLVQYAQGLISGLPTRGAR